MTRRASIFSAFALIAILIACLGLFGLASYMAERRTREIGIRKALGATRANILLQFLIEAVVLCLLGGLIGALVGSGGATAMSAFFQWNTIISPGAIAAAFGAMEFAVE